MDEDLADQLSKSLGPEYVSFKSGFAYIEGHKVIALANQLFGFDGWSTELRNVSIDYVDIKDHKFNIGVKCIIRVTLKSGTFREDLGYGSCINMPHRSQAYDKAHKEAVTDALKRTLRQFGEAMGNCLYNKRYTQDVRTVKAETPEFDPDDLIRQHSTKRRRTYKQENEEVVPQAFQAPFQTPQRLEPLELHNEPAAQPSNPQNQPRAHNPVVHPNQISAQQRKEQELQRQQQEQRERKQRFQQELKAKKASTTGATATTDSAAHSPSPILVPASSSVSAPIPPPNAHSTQLSKANAPPGPELASSDDDESQSQSQSAPMFVSGIGIMQGSQSEYDPSKSTLKTSLPDTSTKVKKQ